MSLSDEKKMGETSKGVSSSSYFHIQRETASYEVVTNWSLGLITATTDESGSKCKPFTLRKRKKNHNGLEYLKCLHQENY